MIMREAKISPKLKAVMKNGENGKFFNLLLKDGRKVKCKLDCITYANTSDEDDTDMMVAAVIYPDGGGELFAESDIEKVLK